MKIVITGSLGHIGKPLTENLVKSGHDVIVISSKQDKQKDIEAVGAKAAIGSLEDGPFLTKTFSGADAVFCMVPPNFSEPDQVAYYERLGDNYAEALSAAGVGHAVYLSSYGADLDKGTGFILGAHRVEGILDKLSGIAVTHLRPGFFYYNLYGFKDMVKHQGIIGSNYGGNDKLILVDPKDIAVAAAEELSAPTTGRKVRYVVSDEHTADEVAHILGEAIGKPDLQWITFSNEQTAGGLKHAGMNEHAAGMMVELGSAIHSGVMLKGYDENRPSKMGTVKMEDFAKEFAAAYNAA